jgi:hypothetical protein
MTDITERDMWNVFIWFGDGLCGEHRPSGSTKDEECLDHCANINFLQEDPSSKMQSQNGAARRAKTTLLATAVAAKYVWSD